MSQIITTYTMLIMFILNVFLCVSVSNATISMSEAKEFKAHVIAEIENSNFNQNVIDACVNQAKAEGYDLFITKFMYDENQDIQTAEVVLTYSYKLPILGVENTKTTRGIAR